MKQQNSAGIKVFTFHLPIVMYNSIKEISDERNVAVKCYILEALAQKLKEDVERGWLQ